MLFDTCWHFNFLINDFLWDCWLAISFGNIFSSVLRISYIIIFRPKRFNVHWLILINLRNLIYFFLDFFLLCIRVWCKFQVPQRKRFLLRRWLYQIFAWREKWIHFFRCNKWSPWVNFFILISWFIMISWAAIQTKKSSFRYFGSLIYIQSSLLNDSHCIFVHLLWWIDCCQLRCFLNFWACKILLSIHERTKRIYLCFGLLRYSSFH